MLGYILQAADTLYLTLLLLTACLNYGGAFITSI